MISPESLLQIAKGHSVTEGELEVLGAIVISGETITDVATRLKLQPEAVRKRLGEVYRKFGILGKGPGKLAKLQQLLMNNPASNSKVRKTTRKYNTRNTPSVGTSRSYGEPGLRANADNLRFQSIADFTKGEGISGETLISDLESYAGSILDWDSAPDVEPFYGRQSELDQLKSWIADEDRSRRSRLVVLYGMGGIGKTFLAVKAGKQLEKDFDAVVWRSIKHTPSLTKLVASIEDVINPGYISAAKLSAEESITKLINSLKDRRCLIILDDLEAIFDPNNVAGCYLPEFEAYSDLIQRIATENHESSVLVVSREKVADIAELEGNRVHTLQISGSEEIAQQIVENQGLEYSEAWQIITRNYGGNPLALKIVITMIQDLYGGQPEEFLKGTRTTSAYFGFRALLDEQFIRLSSKEKELMFVLAILQQASIAKISGDNWLDLSQSDLIEYMSSLRRRSLLERDKSEFSLQPMVWRHTVEKLISLVEEEIIQFIEAEEPNVDDLQTLSSYPWQQKGQDNQGFLSLLQRHFRTPKGKETLSRTLRILEEKYPEESGYAIDNLKSIVELAKV